MVGVLCGESPVMQSGYFRSKKYSAPHRRVRTEDEHEGLLLHPLLGDLLRITVSTFAAGEVGVAGRLLAYTDWCFREGDDYVSNAVAVSFIEDFGAAPSESDALLKRWPSTLQTELGR